MDIDKELEELFNDPLLDISEKETSLFDIPEDMQKVQAGRTQPDHYAQRKVCEDFAAFQSGFLKVHQELKEGKRSQDIKDRQYATRCLLCSRWTTALSRQHR